MRSLFLLLTLGFLSGATDAFAPPPLSSLDVHQNVPPTSRPGGAYVSSHPQPDSSHFHHEAPYSPPPVPQSVTVKQKSSKAKTAATLGLGTAGVTALFMTADGADDTADAVEDLGSSAGEWEEVPQQEAPGGTATTLPGYIGPAPQS